MDQFPQFSIKSDFSLAGDQPKAVENLISGLNNHEPNQVLLGVTGSGKTFTMAHIIAQTKRPALIMAHNKTLAAQLYGEMKEFFPGNAVEYFVSYYDYYQPEAYLPRTDTYIEKDSSINEQIDLMRHSATRSLLERKDVIVVASVSCIYGLGSPELYSKMTIQINKGDRVSRTELAKHLVDLQYKRNDTAFERGSFRIRGDILDIFPSHYADDAWRLSFFGSDIESITQIDALTGNKKSQLDRIVVYPNSHFVTPKPTLERAVIEIKKELKQQVEFFNSIGKIVEARRIEQRTNYDIEMMLEVGTCKGIENYSRFLYGNKPGQPPPTLFSYVPKNGLLFIDESHVTVPQIGAMYNGDQARKQNLVDYGFRLPSARDNRPLKFEEWNEMRPQTIFVSATPNPYEIELAKGRVVEQIIRPTGLIDPVCIVRPVTGQVDDLIHECKIRAARGERILVTTLTKKMAENLSEYLKETGVKTTYLHSEIQTLERIEIIQSLRRGEVDVLVGINLLREGLDIPECSLVAILDADKEGFLRSATSLIQTIGRAARNIDGTVILYADVMTKSLVKALGETDRRRKIQNDWNLAHNITPLGVKKQLNQILDSVYEMDYSKTPETIDTKIKPAQLEKMLSKLRKEMFDAAGNLEFEKAAKLRDKIKQLEQTLLAELGKDG